MSKFDPNRPYVTAGRGLRTFWMQDGLLYDPSTKELVDPASIPPATTRAPVAPSAPPAPAPLICKFCGKARATEELFMEHLLAAHADQVDKERLSAGPDAEPRAKDGKKGRKK